MQITRHYDCGTKIRLERGEIELAVDHSGGQRARVRVVSVLDELYNRRQLNDTQHRAGERLYHDWYYGVASRDSIGVAPYEPRPSQNNGGNKQAEYSDRRMDCWQSYHSAMAMLEAIGRGVVEGVCFYDKTTKSIEMTLGLPRQYGIARLREALDTLAYHYGFVQNKLDRAHR